MDVLEETDWPTWDPDYGLYDRNDKDNNKPVDPDSWVDTDDWNGDY